MTWDDSLKRYNSKYVLLGGFNHLEKCEFVNGKDDNPYMKWKKMFQTTNQVCYHGMLNYWNEYLRVP
jgi:hypothetical protein